MSISDLKALAAHLASFDDMGLDTPQRDLDALRRLAAKACLHWREESGSFSDVECVEVGSWAGRTALVLAEDFTRVYCVDHWEGSPNDCLAKLAKLSTPPRLFQRFAQNVGDKLYRSVIPCFGSSQMYAAAWPRPVAMVYLDADHSFFSLLNNIREWTRHVAPGGILCGHDFSVHFPGVRQAVDELIGEGNYSVEGNVWATRASRVYGAVPGTWLNTYGPV